jgi:hypothetical protein
MNIYIILVIAIILSIGFHFIGVYVNAKKTIWLMIVLMWGGSINIAMSEIKPKGYKDIESMKGKYADTDQLIEESMPQISIYEIILIKSSFLVHEPKR